MPDNDLCETPQPTQQSVLNRSSKDKFVLVLNLPKILREQSFKDKRISIDPLQISIFGTVVPTVQVPSNEVRFGGQSYNVSSYSRPNYSPLVANFFVDNKFKNYWLLWKWLTILNDPNTSYYSGTDPKQENWKTNLETGTLIEYQSNFSILGMNEYNEKTIEFKYKNGFITSLGNIDYDYTNPELIKSTVEFQFSQLDIELFS